jgi:hypothetical protein
MFALQSDTQYDMYNIVRLSFASLSEAEPCYPSTLAALYIKRGLHI